MVEDEWTFDSQFGVAGRECPLNTASSVPCERPFDAADQWLHCKQKLLLSWSIQDHTDLRVWRPCPINVSLPYPPLDNIQVMVIVWRLRVNIIRTASCWVVWHNVHSQQHTHMSSSYRSSRLGLSHWDPYAMHRGGCLELYYCNMMEWSWCDSSLICKTN